MTTFGLDSGWNLQDIAPAMGVYDNIDFARVCADVIRAIRGPRGQAALARILSVRRHTVTQWEIGRRAPDARRFFEICRKLDIDLEAVLVRTNICDARAARKIAQPAFSLPLFLRHLWWDLSVQAIATRQGINRHAVGRWLNGKATPSLRDFFRALRPLELFRLIDALVGLQNVPALGAAVAVTTQRSSALQQPINALMRSAVSTTGYEDTASHQPGWLAQRLGIDPAMEAQSLAEMQEAGLLRLHKGKYTRELALPVNITVAQSQEVNAKWLEYAAHRARTQGTEGAQDMYLVFNASPSQAEKMRQILRQAAEKIADTVRSSKSAEQMGYFVCRYEHWAMG